MKHLRDRMQVMEDQVKLVVSVFLFCALGLSPFIVKKTNCMPPKE